MKRRKRGAVALHATPTVLGEGGGWAPSSSHGSGVSRRHYQHAEQCKLQYFSFQAMSLSMTFFFPATRGATLCATHRWIQKVCRHRARPLCNILNVANGRTNMAKRSHYTKLGEHPTALHKLVCDTVGNSQLFLTLWVLITSQLLLHLFTHWGSPASRCSPV